MPRKPLKAADGEGFLRAFTDAWVDVEKEYGVELELCVFPSKRRGVVDHRIRAWKNGVARSEWAQAGYSFSYPTAQVATYEAALYQALTRLERVLMQQVIYPEGKP